MKTIDELGISPAPWLYSKSIGAILSDSHGVVYDELMLANDARLIAAAPELYACLRDAVIDKCRACAQHRRAACDKIGMADCFVTRWKSVLAKASGEEAK